MEYTLDTTILAKGIIPPRRTKKDALFAEEQRLHNLAKSILTKIESKQSVMNIPTVAIIETAAVARRLTGKEERGIQAADYVRAHGNIIYDIIVIDKAIEIAAKTGVSGFDALFIACAVVTNSVLVTDDKKMFDAAIEIGVSAPLLRDIK